MSHPRERLVVMRNVDFDREIAHVARRQHGTFHTRQARSVGGSADVLRNRVANGAILQLAPKVWAVAGHPPTWRRQYKAAELSVPGSALADRPAGLVHGLDGFRVVRPTLVASGEVNRRQSLADVRRSADVAVTTIDGIRVTSLAQTLFDLLDCCVLPVVERAIDGAVVSGAVSMDQLYERQHAMDRLRRRHVSTWRRLLSDRSTDALEHAESALEVLLHRLVHALPVEVVFQAPVPWWDDVGAHVDAHIPAWRLIIEVDGRRWHSRVADFDRDRWRDNAAAAHGHRVLRFTHAHLTERPAEALSLILGAGSATAPIRWADGGTAV